MATTAAFGSLSVPAPDDSMEMSSPAIRNLDDDIDIDFEDYQGGVHLTDDEQMIEDADPSRPGTGTDDVMVDDLPPSVQVQIDEEEIMQDDAPHVPGEEDEELIDYGEDEFQEQRVDDILVPVVEEPAVVGSDHIDEEVQRIVETSTVDAPTATLIDDTIEDPVQILDLPTSAEDFLASDVKPANAASPEAGRTVVDQQQQAEGPNQANESSHDESSVHEGHASHAPVFVNTGISASTTDTPSTPTDTGLHPMTVRYADLSMPLFKSRTQPDGLLKDDNLASLSLAELIKSCRRQISVKIGEDISDDQEVVLGFEHLGLMLVEDCRAAFESSLNDVLEVYMQLHQNDGTEEIPPLSMNISLQLKFQSSFSILKQAAAGGQGMSSFGFVQTTSERNEEYYHEEYDEDDNGLELRGDQQAEEHFQDQDYDDRTYPDDAGRVARLDLGGEVQAQDFGHGGPADEEDAEYYHEAYYEEAAGDGDHSHDQDETAAKLDGLHPDDGHAGDALYNVVEDPEVSEEGTVAEQHRTVPSGSQGKEHEAASGASSTTVQGDSANDNAEHTGDEQHDFSTFLTEYDEEDPSATLPKNDQGVTYDSGARDEPGRLSNLQSDPRFESQHPGSEDFLHDSHGQEQGDDVYEDDQGYEEEFGSGQSPEQDERYYDDQADTYDEQQDEYHPDYQPGDNEDQYHTAQDFLDAQHYEEGPQDDAHAEEQEDFDDTLGTVIHHETGEYDDEEGQEQFGDEIGLNGTASQVDDSPANATKSTSKPTGSPLGKRSFEQHAELDDLYDDERELKKVRPS